MGAVSNTTIPGTEAGSEDKVRNHEVSNNIPIFRGIPPVSESKYPSPLKCVLFFIGMRNACFHSFPSSESLTAHLNAR